MILKAWAQVGQLRDLDLGQLCDLVFGSKPEGPVPIATKTCPIAARSHPIAARSRNNLFIPLGNAWPLEGMGAGGHAWHTGCIWRAGGGGYRCSIIVKHNTL